MTEIRSASARSVSSASIVLVTAALLLGAVFSGVGIAFRHVTGELRWIRDVDQGPSATITAISKTLSALGSETVLIPVVIVVCALLLRRAPRVAAFVAVSAAGGIGLSSVVKFVVDRPRPPLVHLVHVASSSFPSGHATQTAAILPALAIAAVAFGARRGAALAVAIAGSLMVGVSRVLLGVHYPTDVLAGWLLGGAWFVVAYVALFPDARRR
ncbi:MAG TPA: phosphatase PAP2 family protein [Jatrophihabitantaceae bacterium]|nr:phosphatase PAP2 family protein [Jatrophihabitantaceae bacterium]